jgi:Na+-driven multidrug efflux pump
LGCWLCFGKGWGAVGMWDGLCVALMMTGTTLVWAWRRKTVALNIT